MLIPIQYQFSLYPLSEMINNLQSTRKPQTNHNQQVFHVVRNLKQQISCYQDALKNAQKIISAYKEQNQSYLQQNTRLIIKCGQYENKIKQLMTKLSKNQQRKERYMQMASQIQLLNKKLAAYEKTISILEDKLIILNAAIKKEEHIHKFQSIQQFSVPQLELPKRIQKMSTQQNDYSLKTKKFFKNLAPSTLKRQNYLNTTSMNSPTNSLFKQLHSSKKRIDIQKLNTTDRSNSSRTYSQAYKFD